MQSLIAIEGGDHPTLPLRNRPAGQSTFFSACGGGKGKGEGEGGRGMGVWRVEELEGHKCYHLFGYREVCMYGVHMYVGRGVKVLGDNARV